MSATPNLSAAALADARQQNHRVNGQLGIRRRSTGAATGTAVRHLVQVPASADAPESTIGPGLGEQTLMAVVYLTDAIEHRTVRLEDVRARFAPHVDEATFDRFAADIDRRRVDLEDVHALQVHQAREERFGRPVRLEGVLEIARHLGVGSREDFSSDEEFLAETEAAAADEAAEAIIRLLADEDRSTSVAIGVRSPPTAPLPRTGARHDRARRQAAKEFARALRLFERRARHRQIAEARSSALWGDQGANAPGRRRGRVRPWFAVSFVGASCAITIALAAWVVLSRFCPSPDPAGGHRSRASVCTHTSWPG